MLDKHVYPGRLCKAGRVKREQNHRRTKSKRGWNIAPKNPNPKIKAYEYFLREFQSPERIKKDLNPVPIRQINQKTPKWGIRYYQSIGNSGWLRTRGFQENG